MKINNKISLVLLISFVFVIITIIIYTLLSYKNNKQLLLTYKSQYEQVVSSVTGLKSNTIKSLAYDYTYYDEMVEYVNGKQSKAWEEEILSTILQSYKMDAEWVFNLKKKKIFHKNLLNDSIEIAIDISDQIWDSLYKKHFISFIQKTNYGYIEIHGATIHPSSDIERKTNPEGYFFIGKLYNNTYLNELSTLTNSDVKIVVNDSLVPLIDNTYLNLPVPLLSADNQKIATIIFSRNFKFLHNLINMSLFYLIFVISAIIITFLSFYLLFRLWVNKPLRLIMRSLSENNTDIISPLLKTKNEFGKIGELLKKFILQKEILQDEIAKRKEIEIAFTVQEKLYKILFDSSLIGVCFSKDQKIINANQTVTDLFGFKTLDALKKYKIYELVDDESKAKIIAHYKNRITHKINEDSFEITVLCQDGSQKEVMVYSQDIELDNEIYQQTIFNEITAKKIAERELLLEKAYFKQLFDKSPEAIIVADNQGVILKVNNSFTKLFGYNLHEAIGKTTTELLQPNTENVDSINLITSVLNGETISYEAQRKHKNGSLIDVHILGTPIIINNCQSGVYAIYRDITDKKKYNEELKLRSKLFKSLSGGLSNLWKFENDENSIKFFLGTIGNSVKADRVYLFKNEKLENDDCMTQIFEWVNENIKPEIENPSLNKLMYHPHYSRWYKLMKNGEIISGLTKNLEKSEQEILISQSIKAILLNPIFVRGEFWGFLGMDNCTEEREWNETEIAIISMSAVNIGNYFERLFVNDELLFAKNKAEESDKLKSNFIANMSHELRTPLNGILGFAELLTDELDNDEHKEMLSVIQKSGNRLMDTLNSILDLSLIEANKIVVEKVDIDVNALLNEKNLYFYQFALQRNLYFRIESDKNYHIYSDIKMLSRIINNLLDNAFKYTKEGGVTIKLSDEIIDDVNYLVVKIIDSGIGIDEKDFKKIFQYFRQVSEGLSREYEGNGIGLTICKEYVDLLNGTIDIESKINKGSVFTIKLPGIIVSEIKNDRNDKNKLTDKYKILLVEDEVSNREYTYFVLSKEFEIDVAENALLAIDMTNSKKYDIILMDINLGKGMNGIEAAFEIRKNPDYKYTPIAAVTANAMQGQKEEYLKNGLTHYISKPYTKMEIIDFVKKIITIND